MPEPEHTPEAPAAEPAVERGAYEILRDRLLEQGRWLRDRANELNRRRLELFGGTEMTVLGQVLIRTENNCVPRDLVAVDSRLLFGYNVFLGLKAETAVSDVFSLHTLAGGPEGPELLPVPPGAATDFLVEPSFVRDFRELYRFYRDTRLRELQRVEGKLLAVFQIGEALRDQRVFRWSVDVRGAIAYLDNAGERDLELPPSHDFTWTPTSRDDHVLGRHPHVSILDEVFVETVGGDLTIKVEDNTEDGQGVWREPVDDPDQSLDDAHIEYAKLGTLILLKVLPYKEKDSRHLVYNTRTRAVDRIDAIGQACVQLPEDHGIIFPGGYYLQSGETKTFDTDVEGLQFRRMVRSPNGEDVLYVFRHAASGRAVLLSYNLIRKQVENPIHCHGFTLFEDGKLLLFRALSEEPTRVHRMQVWATPFVSEEQAEKVPRTGSFLEKVGNADLVRGISDALGLVKAIEAQKPSVALYEDLVKAATRVLDSYHWLGNPEVGDWLGTLQEIRRSAELVIGEFVKVEALREEAESAVQGAEAGLRRLVATLRPESWTRVDEYVAALSELRNARGRLITLGDLRYVDRGHLAGLEAQAVEQFDRVGALAVSFLLGERALEPYQKRIEGLLASIGTVERAADAEPVQESLEAVGQGLDLLTQVVGGLEIKDATQRTRILEGIAEALGSVNRARAVLRARLKELVGRESVAEFAAQFKVLGQTVLGALSLCDSPEACDEHLSRLLLQIEELEGRFGELEEFLTQLAAKREEVAEAFAARKQALLDGRQRRAQNTMRAAERILDGALRRALTLDSVDALNAYFASDPMVGKLRDLAGKLRDLGDRVRADEVESRLKATREQAARSLRDRQDLFEEGTQRIRLGRHRFSVNSQPLDLTVLPKEGRLWLHLAGTDFFDPLEDPELERARELWEQTLVSETPEVYRGEYLAASLLLDAEEGVGGLSLRSLHDAERSQGGLLAQVRARAQERYDEGYERGVSDGDAARILERLLALHATAGRLRFPPRPRAAALLFWAALADTARRKQWTLRARSLGRMQPSRGRTAGFEALAREMAEPLGSFAAAHHVPLGAADGAPDHDAALQAAAYLCEELWHEPQRFVVSAAGDRLRGALLAELEARGARHGLETDLEALAGDLATAQTLARSWLEGFLERAPAGEQATLRPALDEAVVLLVAGRRLDLEISSAAIEAEVTELLGQHPRIVNRRLVLRLDEFLARLGRFRRERVPAFRAYLARRHEVLERERERLRLREFAARVMTGFVRNRLLDQVYLPLIGDNLAKQMGALGEGKRTDLMGMLLLVSPPGYGKTTLMEYVANRLGLVFVKVNGPAVGSAVRSLDPAEAPNATARQEVERINFALEMGNNVLLYLDDIQHTSPELLQKFISLCDAQRRIEGVWKGRVRTYDLRGKRFVVCMAGNPYTESGHKFRIPDMLANRADVYNLGDILKGKDDLFALSYLENALTSNPVLQPLSARDPEDFHKLVRMARGEAIEAGELKHAYSALETQDLLAVLRKLFHVQEVLLRINQQYILSASQADAYRSEPPFLLQGSYRNMNKLAEKVLPVLNDEELEGLLDDHYRGEAQTLTSGAEQNLLKLAELRGRMSQAERERWDEIKRGFARSQLVGGKEEDPVVRVTRQLAVLGERLADIGKAVEGAARDGTAGGRGTPALGETLAPLLERLDRSVEAMARVQARPTVVNVTAPPHELLVQQAEILEATLIPLLRQASERLQGTPAAADARLARVLQALPGVRTVNELIEALKGLDPKGEPAAPQAKREAASEAPPSRPAPPRQASPPSRDRAAGGVPRRAPVAGVPLVSVSLNGLGPNVTAVRGWPLLLEVSLLHPDAAAGAGGSPPILLEPRGGDWSRAMALEVRASDGITSRRWPFRLAATPPASLALGAHVSGSLLWWLGAEQSAALPAGAYTLEVVLDLSQGGGGGAAYRGRVSSEPARLKLADEPAEPGPADLEEKHRLQASLALLLGEPAGAEAEVAKLLGRVPDSVVGITLKGDLSAHQGRRDEALRLYEQASRLLEARLAREPEPGRDQALLGELARKRRALESTRRAR